MTERRPKIKATNPVETAKKMITEGVTEATVFETGFTGRSNNLHFGRIVNIREGKIRLVR